MAKLTLGGRSGRRLFVIGAAVAAIILALAGMTVSASANPPKATSDVSVAMGRRGSRRSSRKRRNALVAVPGDTFAQSVHGVIGCTGCHTDIIWRVILRRRAPIADRARVFRRDGSSMPQLS